MEISYGVVLAVAAGLTQFIKTNLGLVDTAASVVSGLVCTLVGAAYQYTVTKPLDFNGWFTVVLVGLITWLTTAGLYKIGFAFAERMNSNNTK